MRRYMMSLLLTAISLVAGSAGGHAQSFKAEIRLNRTAVKNNETIYLTTELRNAGMSDEEIEVWPCTYPAQWVVDNPIVHVNDSDCLKDSPVKLSVKAGKAYERTVPIHVELGVDHSRFKSVTFRLCYGTKTPRGVWKPWPGIPPIWSNAVTVVVNEE